MEERTLILASRKISLSFILVSAVISVLFMINLEKFQQWFEVDTIIYFRIKFREVVGPVRSLHSDHRRARVRMRFTSVGTAAALSRMCGEIVIFHTFPN